MKNQMRVVLDQATPGMIVDESIRNRQGALLLKSGASLTAKNLIMLKSWGVPFVIVKGSPGLSSDPIGSQQDRLEKIHQTLDVQFSDHEGNPVMVEIKRVAAGLIKDRTFKHQGVK